MRRLTIVIATNSHVIASGLKAILLSTKELQIEPLVIMPSNIFSTVKKLIPAAVIADLCDHTCVNELKRVREELDGRTSLIGIYHAALNDSAIRSVDSTISIYDSPAAICNSLQKLITVSSETSPSELTPREQEVIKGIVKGLSNKEIASEINVSVNTVMTHRRNITSKLRIHSAAGLTIYAIVSKLVSLDEIKEAIND